MWMWQDSNRAIKPSRRSRRSTVCSHPFLIPIVFMKGIRTLISEFRYANAFRVFTVKPSCIGMSTHYITTAHYLCMIHTYRTYLFPKFVPVRPFHLLTFFKAFAYVTHFSFTNFHVNFLTNFRVWVHIIFKYFQRTFLVDHTSFELVTRLCKSRVFARYTNDPICQKTKTPRTFIFRGVPFFWVMFP